MCDSNARSGGKKGSKRDGIGPPSNVQPKAYFEWSYPVHFDANVTEVHHPLWVVATVHVTIRFITITAQNLSDGQTVNGEIQYLSTLDANNRWVMRVPLPTVTKVQGQPNLQTVENTFFQYFSPTTSGSTGQEYRLVVDRNSGTGPVTLPSVYLGTRETNCELEPQRRVSV